MKRNFLLFLASTFSLIGILAQTPVLKVEGGQISGVAGDIPGLTVYKGIPYAAPPVDDLRWKQPQPVKAWQDVRKCDKFGAASLQGDQNVGSFYWKEFYQSGNPERSEDCLYLNVWTPAAGKNTKLPVIFWIHGGGYMAGYGHELEFDGNAYAKKGVILVTINYRLGMCGFLAHPLLTAENGGKGSGNYGLFDQLAALKWVKNNIAAFGGNPENITVMGQSAGAGSVQSLISSPLSKGIIQRAIIQSGGGLGGIITAKPLLDAEKAGKDMWGESGATTLQEMRNYPADKFMEVLMKYMMKQKNFGGLPYSPDIDGQLLTASLNDVAKAGNQLDIPNQSDAPSQNPDDKMAILTKSVMENSCVKYVEEADEAHKTQLRSVQWFVDCGDDDFLLHRNIEFTQAMRKAQIPAQFRVRDGGHTWEYWHSALYTCLPFVTRTFSK